MNERGLVDVHTHVVPEHFPAYLGVHDGAPWPSMAPAQACHRHVMVSGRVYRTVAHQCWDCGARHADMKRLGVERQVLSPMPELLSYWLAPEDGAAMCRYLNEVIATMVAESPSRFCGLGAVPLQDVALAIDALDHAVHSLGLAGVEIGTNVNGVVIGDPCWRPFFEAAAEWGAAIFIHPLRPAGMDRLIGPAALEQVLAFPGEMGLAGASLITGGLLDALPTLRIALSHGGGSLGLLLPRLQHAYDQLPALRKELPCDPTAAARRLFVDNLVYDAPTLHHLIRIFGEQQVMVGSDYPFVIQDADPAARLNALGLPADTLRLLRHANAERWLGLATTS
jgi:aminocarboxymuconate-semialdehyde decarboxylase